MPTSPRARERRAGRYRLNGSWESLEPPVDGVMSRMLNRSTVLAQVRRESLEYG